MTTKKPNARDEEIGRRIRARRLSIGMSQTVLGERLGVTFQQVQKYEKGVNRVGGGRLEDLTRILGVPITFFYDDATPASGNANTLLGIANTPQAFRLLKAFSSIDDARTRQPIVDLVVQLARRSHEAGKPEIEEPFG